MKINWFLRNGILFTPASIPGWLIFILSAGYSVYCFVEIDRRSHSVSDTMMNFVFRLIIIYIVYSLIALVTSRKKKV